MALPGDDAPPPPDDVLLVREIKGTAVRDPAPAAALRELPGAPARSAAEGAGEVTNVLCGPGFRRRRSVPWRWLVWILALAAGLLLWR